MKFYVASSWRNIEQPGVVAMLRHSGHEVYDFRNPPHGRGGKYALDVGCEQSHLGRDRPAKSTYGEARHG